jgi:hypothetical protein
MAALLSTSNDRRKQCDQPESKVLTHRSPRGRAEGPEPRARLALTLTDGTDDDVRDKDGTRMQLDEILPTSDAAHGETARTPNATPPRVPERTRRFPSTPRVVE